MIVAQAQSAESWRASRTFFEKSQKSVKNDTTELDNKLQAAQVTTMPTQEYLENWSAFTPLWVPAGASTTRCYCFDEARNEPNRCSLLFNLIRASRFEGIFLFGILSLISPGVGSELAPNPLTRALLGIYGTGCVRRRPARCLWQ